MVYRNYPRDDWRRASHIDSFLSMYYEDYAMSSNRLAFLEGKLGNTNVMEKAGMQFVKERFISITNQLHHAPQPLPQVSIGGGNE